MNIWQKLLFVMSLFSYLDAQLKAANQTPVDGTATIDFSASGQALEVSESGEHWVPVSQTWKRVK